METGRLVTVGDTRLFVAERSGHFAFVEEQDAYLAAVRGSLIA
jgi:hypothetical protein